MIAAFTANAINLKIFVTIYFKTYFAGGCRTRAWDIGCEPILKCFELSSTSPATDTKITSGSPEAMHAIKVRCDRDAASFASTSAQGENKQGRPLAHLRA